MEMALIFYSTRRGFNHHWRIENTVCSKNICQKDFCSKGTFVEDFCQQRLLFKRNFCQRRPLLTQSNSLEKSVLWTKDFCSKRTIVKRLLFQKNFCQIDILFKWTRWNSVLTQLCPSLVSWAKARIWHTTSWRDPKDRNEVPENQLPVGKWVWKHSTLVK